MPVSASAKPSVAGWRLRSADHAKVDVLARALALPRAVSQVMVARGVSDVEGARRFLDPKLAHLSAPAQMAGFEHAVERLVGAIIAAQHIGIFADYDVDGVSSAALMASYLQACGASFVVRVARRDEGYGFQVQQANELLQAGCELILLLDCGTSDLQAVNFAAAAGAEVIALDHHRVPEGPWPGLVLLNPQRRDCSFPYKGLCSAGLAFYLCAGLRSRLSAAGREAPDPRSGLDLVALGTVADVAPLDGDNRILVARGLEALARTTRPGLKALLRIAELDQRPISADDVGWRLAPRLNAPGRLGDAQLALDCLWHRDPERSIAAAQACEACNVQRKELQQQVLQQAREQLEAAGQRNFFVLAKQDWPAGVVGIVAARLAQEQRRPVAVVALEGSVGRASVRTAAGLDVYQLLAQCEPWLRRFGGHSAAAGFSVEQQKIPALTQALDQAATAALADAPPIDGLTLDGVLAFEQLDLDLCGGLARLAPYGAQHPPPAFGSADVFVESCRPVGRSSLALNLRQGTTLHNAIAFNMADRPPAPGSMIDVAYLPEIDTYRPKQPRLRVLDWHAAATTRTWTMV